MHIKLCSSSYYIIRWNLFKSKAKCLDEKINTGKIDIIIIHRAENLLNFEMKNQHFNKKKEIQTEFLSSFNSYFKCRARLIFLFNDIIKFSASFSYTIYPFTPMFTSMVWGFYRYNHGPRRFNDHNLSFFRWLVTFVYVKDLFSRRSCNTAVQRSCKWQCPWTNYEWNFDRDNKPFTG